MIEILQIYVLFALDLACGWLLQPAEICYVLAFSNGTGETRLRRDGETRFAGSYFSLVGKSNKELKLL